MFWKNNDQEFENIFRDHAANTVKAAGELGKLFADMGNGGPSIQKIAELEHENDRLAARAHELLDSTFITRLDKPDIITLLDQMDHVTDTLKNVSGRIGLYHLREPFAGAAEIAGIIMKMAALLEEMFGNIAKLKPENAKRQVLAVKELEEQADNIFARELEKLLAGQPDWKNVMMWKDVLQMLEKATDHCTGVAYTVNSIVRKEAR